MWRSDILFLKDVSAYCISSKGPEYKLNKKKVVHYFWSDPRRWPFRSELRHAVYILTTATTTTTTSYCNRTWRMSFLNILHFIPPPRILSLSEAYSPRSVQLIISVSIMPACTHRHTQITEKLGSKRIKYIPRNIKVAVTDDVDVLDAHRISTYIIPALTF